MYCAVRSCSALFCFVLSYPRGWVGNAKQINKKVMGMIEKAETEYKELVRKKQVIEDDKKKIYKVINELDQKKQQALQVKRTTSTPTCLHRYWK